MTTVTKTTHKYNLEEDVCNRGMIPKVVRAQIRRENPDLTDKTINECMKEIATRVSATNVAMWLECLKQINKKRNNKTPLT